MDTHTFLLQMFFDYFNSPDKDNGMKNTAVIMPLEGRSFPVDVHYLSTACHNYVQETVDTVLKIHKSEPPGDILAFLTGAVSSVYHSSNYMYIVHSPNYTHLTILPLCYLDIQKNP